VAAVSNVPRRMVIVVEIGVEECEAKRGDSLEQTAQCCICVAV
jgi:hypothetical protein